MVNKKEIPKKLYTLRSHSSPLVCIQQIQPIGSPPVHSILTSDLDGGLVWWDISVTHRPLKSWKGHDGSIVTIKQLNDRPNLILTHGKDHSIKLWDINELQGDGVPNFIEIPVNTLNFCNVDYLDNHLLTASTMDSNNFDIYTLFEDSQFSLNRIFTNIDPYALSVEKEGIEDEINENPIGNKRGKFGIMMKVLFVSPSTFFIGYESGHLLGFNLIDPSSTVHEKSSHKIKNKTVINKSGRVELIYESDFHHPNPILSLEHDPINNILLSGLADKKVQIVHLNGEFTTDSFSTHHLGSQSIAVGRNQRIAIQSWDGSLRGYDLKFNELFKLQRDLERINKIDSFATNDDVSKGNKAKNKISAIKYLNVDTLENTALSYKQLIRSRKRALNNNLLFVGYNDGIVDAFDTEVTA